jgi:hypothetical protein
MYLGGNAKGSSLSLNGRLHIRNVKTWEGIKSLINGDTYLNSEYSNTNLHISEHCIKH